jgi:hypothetical protein
MDSREQKACQSNKSGILLLVINQSLYESDNGKHKCCQLGYQNISALACSSFSLTGRHSSPTVGILSKADNCMCPKVVAALLPAAQMPGNACASAYENHSQNLMHPPRTAAKEARDAWHRSRKHPLSQTRSVTCMRVNIRRNFAAHTVVMEQKAVM